ncbi:MULTISPECIES: aminopeptidase [Halobacterium]|uniref:aminopeptidase n=1 Tax=Halobacterium TaxID=2239 RepID=UPI00073EABBD|nr:MULTISPECIES: aminopeptidase [Halobacterium]MCG1002124.1 aminopeptidase [Halobacterium noricense]
MDDRVRRHAEVLVEDCTEIQPGDMVQVRASREAEALVVALYEKLGEIGARPSLHWGLARASRAYNRAMDADDYETKAHELAAMEETDAVFLIGGGGNAFETSDVPPEKSQAASRAHGPILEERLGTRWVITQHPTPADAQKAEMSTAAYENFVYEAVNKDWDAQREFQSQLVEILDPADEVRVVSGDTTDVTMSVAGMDAANDWGTKNMPAGEVFTCPVPDSVEGEVLFDKPLIRQGKEITDAWLQFEDGEVVDFAAGQNEAALEGILETDEGSRRLGELGIGMNRDIDRFTYNMLFDEKMGDTVHMAVGGAIAECVPEDQTFNESATHVDMIVDMSEDSFIEIDGEIVQRDGTFRFEDGFEA